MLFFASPSLSQISEKVFAPYVDVLLYPTFSINDAFDQTGQPYFTLAFVTADTDCKPGWGGVIADVASERFYLSDAEELLSWAEATVVMLSMWSASRDNGGCGHKIWANPTCSGLTQSNFAFTDIFTPFNNDGTGNLHPQEVITSPLEGDTFEPGDTVILSADTTEKPGRQNGGLREKNRAPRANGGYGKR